MTADVSAGRLYAEVVSDTSGFARDLRAKINAEVKDLRAKIKVELDSRGLAGQARKAAKEASAAATVKLKTELDTKGLIGQARTAAALASQAATVKLKTELDTKGLVGEARTAAALASQSATVKLKAELDTREVATAAKAATAAASTDGGVKVPVGADTDQVEKDVDAVKEKVKRSKPVEIPVKTPDSTKSGSTMNLKQLGTAITGLSKAPAIAGGVFLLGTAVVQLGGGLVAMTSAATQAVGVLGALPNLAGIAAQGLGSLLIGVSGVGGALQAMAKAESASIAASDKTSASARATARAVESASRARARAARSVEDAQRALQDAQRNADDSAQAGARAVRDAQRAVADARVAAAERSATAIERISDAEWTLARAEESSRDSQIALTKARDDARKHIEDLNRALKGSALDEEAAMLAVEQARQNLQDTNWNPMSSDLQRKQADLAYRQALQNLDDVKARGEDLQKETEKANKKGVEGSDEVQQANDQVRDSLHAQQEAVENLAKAQKDAAKEQTASARAIADAQENLGLTIKANARQAQESARQIELAQRGIADAQQNLADAEQNLADAQETAKAGSKAAQTAANAAQAALNALGPAARKFAIFLFGLKPRWIELRNAIAGALLPPLQRGIAAALPLLSTLQTGLVQSGAVVGGFIEQLGKLLGSGLFRKDVATIMASNNRAMVSFGAAGLSVVKILQDLAVAAGPLVERFARWVAALTAGWQQSIRAARETGKLTEFFQKSGDMAALLGKILGNLGRAIFNMGKAAAPAGRDLLNTLSGVVQKWAEWTGSDAGQQRMQQFFESVKPATEELGKLVANLVEFITKTGESGGGALTGFLQTLNGILTALNALMSVPGVGPAISGLLTLAGVGGALGLVSGSILKMAGSLTKVAKITGLQKIADQLFGIERGAGAAGDSITGKLLGKLKGLGPKLLPLIAPIGEALGPLLMNPVTLAIAGAVALIGGAFFILYKKNETFRTAVQRAWAAIKQAIAWTWVNAIKPVFDAFGQVLRDMAPQLQALWKESIQPVFQAIGSLLALVWANFIRPALVGFVTTLKALAVVIGWLWKNVAQPTLSFLAAFMVFTITKIIAPALIGMIVGIRAVAAVIGWWWKNVTRPTLSAIGAYFKFIWEKVIKPAWDAMTTGIRWGWDHIVKPAFDALKAGIGSMGKAFDTARDLVKTAWDKIKQVVKDPIKAVLQLVNDWVIDKFNFVSGKLGGPQIDKIDLSKFADGGDIPGKRRGAKADNVIIRATPDEFMVRRWAADRLRKMAPGALEYINRFGMLPGYATGGFIRGVKALAGYKDGGFIRPVNAPWAGTWGHYASGGSHPALDFPVPIGTPVSAVMDGVVNAVKSITGSYGNHIRITHTNGIESIYAHLSKMIVQVGQKVSAGDLIGASGNSGNSTGPHLHLELRRGGVPFDFTDMLRSGKAPGGGGKNAIQQLLGKIGDKLGGIVGNPLEWFKSQIGKPVQQLKDRFGNSTMAQMAAAMPAKLVESAADKVKALVGLSSDNSDPGDVGRGNQSNRDIVRAAAAARGWTGAQWQALEWLVDHESGFSNTAQNPTSTARGLFQFLDSTWASVGGFKTDDPVLQTKFGLKYIAQRYGDPIGAKAFWQSHHWYDKGGWMMPGTGLHTNQTGKPEAVLTNPQWNTVEDILSRLAQVSTKIRPVEATKTRSGALVEHLEVNVQDERDLPEALAEVNHNLRVIDRGGVYANSAG